MALDFFQRKKGPEPVPERDRIRKVPVKHEYSRPVFLELSKKQADSKDHGICLVLTPNDVLRMLWCVGLVLCTYTHSYVLGLLRS